MISYLRHPDFLCSRSLFHKFSETISLLFTSLRMESADFPSRWMALFKDLSFGLIIEPSLSGTSPRAGGRFVASAVPLLQGARRGQGLGRSWLPRWPTEQGCFCARAQARISQSLRNEYSPCCECNSPNRKLINWEPQALRRTSISFRRNER